MGVYIKGMEMPKEGSCIQIVIDDDEKVYPAIEKCIMKTGSIAKAVPVPPHGRLIDADAALRDGWTINRTYSASPTEMVYEVKAIDCLPTVIPAEEGE